jgi:GPH family glycoside/pentoside/hexuronide:cation symporter
MAVSVRAQAAYAAPGLVLALMAMTFYAYLNKFYSDVVRIDGHTLGVIILLSRVWDAIVDPGLGMLSDRTRTRWGRRRPWMAAAAVPTAIAFTMLTVPPEAAAVPWIAAWLLVFFLCWGALTIPYEALGAELSEEYDERTRVLGAREAAVIAGTMLAAVIPLALERSIRDPAARLRLVGTVYGWLLIGAVALCVFFVRERRLTPAQRPRGGALRGFVELWRVQPFRSLLGAYAMAALVGSFCATLLLFYVEHVLKSTRSSLYLAMFFGCALAFVPMWVRLSRTHGKRATWMASMAIGAASLAAMFFLRAGQELLYGALIVVSGIAYGATMALSSSMQADVIDYDEWRGGTRREGAFIGVWAVVKKLVMALGAAVPFPILAASGYRAGEPPSEGALLALRVLYAAVPCACTLAAMAILLRFPIDREMHARIRDELDARSR